MAFRTGYEGLAGAVQGAFDTFWRRKEGQRERDASMEKLKMQLAAAKEEGDTQREHEIQAAIDEHTRAKELKGIPSLSEVTQTYVGAGDGGSNPAIAGIKLKITEDATTLSDMIDNLDLSYEDVRKKFKGWNLDILKPYQWDALQSDPNMAYQWALKQAAQYHVFINSEDIPALGKYLVNELQPMDWTSAMEEYEKSTADTKAAKEKVKADKEKRIEALGALEKATGGAAGVPPVPTREQLFNLNLKGVGDAYADELKRKRTIMPIGQP